MNLNPIVKYKNSNRSLYIQRTMNKCINHILYKTFVWYFDFSDRIKLFSYLHFA